MLKGKKVGHFFGRSYLRLYFVKKNSKMLLAFFHLGVDIDLIDCLVEKNWFTLVKRM